MLNKLILAATFALLALPAAADTAEYDYAPACSAPAAPAPFDGAAMTPAQLDDVADFVATFARIDSATTPQEWLEDPKVAEHPGLEPFRKECATCHIMEGLSEDEEGMRPAPKLFAWGSPQWVARMIRKPGAPDLYGYLEKKDQMPAFADQLTENDTNTLIRYHRDDYPGATFSEMGPPEAKVARASPKR